MQSSSERAVRKPRKAPRERKAEKAGAGKRSHKKKASTLKPSLNVEPTSQASSLDAFSLTAAHADDAAAWMPVALALGSDGTLSTTSPEAAALVQRLASFSQTRLGQPLLLCFVPKAIVEKVDRMRESASELLSLRTLSVEGFAGFGVDVPEEPAPQLAPAPATLTDPELGFFRRLQFEELQSLIALARACS
jgi:NAD kinase